MTALATRPAPLPRTGQRVPATEAAAHVRALLELGASARGIAEVSGVSLNTVARVASGRITELYAPFAARLLQVELDHILSRPRGRGFVPRVGSVRRVQALMALGHSSDEIGAAAGIPGYLVLNVAHTPGRWISRSRHDDIVRAYEQLSMVPGRHTRQKAWARRGGWLPPLAWDDEDLDRVDAVPVDAAVPAPVPVGRPSQDTAEDVEFLLEVCGRLTAAQVAERLGVSRDAITKALERAGREDLLVRLVRNGDLARPFFGDTKHRLRHIDRGTTTPVDEREDTQS